LLEALGREQLGLPSLDGRGLRGNAVDLRLRFPVFNPSPPAPLPKHRARGVKVFFILYFIYFNFFITSAFTVLFSLFFL
jgi:hypothetical protein